VVVTHRGARAAIETFGILISEPDRAADQISERAFHDMSMIHVRHDVGLTGSFDRLSSEGERLMLDEINEAATSVAADGVTRVVDGDGYSFVIDAGGGVKIEASSDPTDLWPRIRQRLHQKAAASARSGASWLRIDVVSGLWQFTDWAMRPFSEKASLLADAVRPAVIDATHLEGVMISSGACFVPGVQHDADTHGDGVIGLRRVLQPLRVRESIVIGLRAGADLALLADLYSEEPRWLGWALADAGLPQPDTVLAYRQA
jgi:hypothetical protein